MGVGRVNDAAPRPVIGAIVLAAGLSRRMGQAKLVLPVGGKPMLARTLGQVAAADLPALLVTGGHEKAVLEVAPDMPWVHAPEHALGLAESLKVGLAHAPAEWAAALVVLGDMPFVASETLRRLAAALAEGASAVVPVEAGRRGNPAGFARSAWPLLMTLSGDQGARKLLDELGVREILVDDQGIHHDFDLPGDLDGL